MTTILTVFDKIHSMLPQPVHGRSIVFVYGPSLDHLDGFTLVYALTFMCFFLNSDNRFKSPSRITDAQSVADDIPEFSESFTQTENLGFVMACYDDIWETNAIVCTWDLFWLLWDLASWKNLWLGRGLYKVMSLGYYDLNFYFPSDGIYYT